MSPTATRRGRTTGRVVLVTGAAEPFGAAVSDALRVASGVESVVAVDTSAGRSTPTGDEGETLRRVDPRTPSIARLIAEVAPDTVVHLGLTARPGLSGGRAAMKERNVIGTMQLLAACQKAPGVRRLVVRSSGSVYGGAARDPATFAEDTMPHRPPRSGYGKDVAEVEGYVRGFARRRPDVAVTVLRFAPMLGPAGDSPLRDYLRLPLLPTVLGYDPRLQFLHSGDAIEAVRRAVTATSLAGTFNVAGEGSLLLSQIARRLAAPTLPVPTTATGTVARLLRRGGLVDFTPDQLDLLVYGRVLDITAMRQGLGTWPLRGTEETLEEFVAERDGHAHLPTDRALAAIDRLQAALALREARRMRGEGQTPDGGSE